MKKLSLAVSTLAILFFVSCKEEPKEPVVNEITIEQTKIDSTTTDPAEAKEDEGTKIKLSSDGVEYSDGKTEVEVSKDGAEAKKK
jgi:hypothetical protein